MSTAGPKGKVALVTGGSSGIVKAATARRPKSRYSTGKGASTVMTMRRALPDRAFDAILTRLYLR
jgi:NAD(P)-dependent dehydrogenase (short-subunit alcohol dehydrogenase family)